MADNICPACGCAIAGGGYEEKGVTYCCRPCAMNMECTCGCCEPVEEEEPKASEVNTQ